jgi:hypothetical protein
VASVTPAFMGVNYVTPSACPLQPFATHRNIAVTVCVCGGVRLKMTCMVGDNWLAPIQIAQQVA